MPKSPVSSSAAEQSRRGKRPRSNRSRWLKLLVVAVATAGVILAGSLWLRERSLAEAAAAVDSGDTKYAMYLVSRLLDGHPNDARALALQARVLVKLGQADEAIAIFEHIGAAKVEDMHALSTAYMASEQWTSAQSLLTGVLQITPNDSDALYEITSCQIRLGRFDEAMKNAERFAEVSGQLARANVLIGSIYGAISNEREAALAFERVLEKEPKAEHLQISAAEFFLRYGRVLMALGKPQEALMPLKLSAADQENGEVFTLLGDAASQLGNQENAVAAWKKAVEVDAENWSARESLANAALLTGDGKQALEWLQPLGSENKPAASVAYLLQRTYALLGDQVEATAWQEKAAEARREESVISAINSFVVTDPTSFWSRAARAHQFAAEKNWGQAELLVEGLIQEAPGDPFVIELADAVQRRSELPELSRIPVVQH